MNIIICGAGKVGFSISKQLSTQGHSVTVIDQSSEDVKKINDTQDVKGIVGRATLPSVLENAGVSFDRRLGSGDNQITTGLSFHFADATLAYYQGVVIRSRMGANGVSMYPYATSFYTC